MTAAASPTQGALLQLSIASTFTTISRRTRIKPNEQTPAKIETTDLDSTWETSIAGIPRGGELEFELNIDPNGTTDAALWTSFGSGTVEAWKYKLANSSASAFAFSGFITSYQLGEMTTDGLQKATLKIQVTGAVTLTV